MKQKNPQKTNKKNMQPTQTYMIAEPLTNQ